MSNGKPFPIIGATRGIKKVFRYKGASVEVEKDGGILVKPGDTLSKYYSCIYQKELSCSDYSVIGLVFGRQGKKGRIEAFAMGHDINKIYAGETIYHIASLNLQKPARGTYKNPIVINLHGVDLWLEFVLTRSKDILFMVAAGKPDILLPFQRNLQLVSLQINREVNAYQFFCPADDIKSIWQFIPHPTSGNLLPYPADDYTIKQFERFTGKPWLEIRQKYYQTKTIKT